MPSRVSDMKEYFGFSHDNISFKKLTRICLFRKPKKFGRRLGWQNGGGSDPKEINKPQPWRKMLPRKT